MRFVSVCSGIEAASLALEPIGYEPAAFSEVDPFCCAHLAERFPHVPNLGDLTKWQEWDLPQADMLIGGTPCQAFSTAGARRSMNDDRANLALNFVELFYAGGFAVALWENVPGVLNTNDNAFGCFLGGLVGADGPIVPTGRFGRGRSNAWQWVKHRRFRHKGRRRYRKGFWKPVWPSVGMVAGPLGRAAWSIRNAEHFGLAQRRKRVFVVVSAGAAGPDPAAVLFERQGMPWHFETSGEEGADVAGALKASIGMRGAPDAYSAAANHIVPYCQGTNFGGSEPGNPTLRHKGGDVGHGGEALVACYGGNNSSGTIDVATTLNSHGGPNGRCDYESETFFVHTLRGEGFDAGEDGTGRGTPLVPVPFDPIQITSGENRSNPQPGQPCHTLPADSQPPCLAFVGAIRGRDDGAQIELENELSSDLRSSNGGSSRAIAFDARQSDVCIYGDQTGSLDTDQQSIGIMQQGVRRLTPKECERLQGMPDDWTAVTYRGKPAADGNRYKAIGNSFAVPVVRWIGKRILAAIKQQSEAA